jgi:hypothetical protein
MLIMIHENKHTDPPNNIARDKALRGGGGGVRERGGFTAMFIVCVA